MCMTDRISNIIFPTDRWRKHYFKRQSKSLFVAPAPLSTTAKKAQLSVIGQMPLSVLINEVSGVWDRNVRAPFQLQGCQW